MRKLVIALLVLIIVVAALLGWALYNIDSLIASNKDRIIAAAERHTGRKIAFERMSVKLLGGIGVRIQDVSIAEAPGLRRRPFPPGRGRPREPCSPSSAP